MYTAFDDLKSSYQLSVTVYLLLFFRQTLPVESLGKNPLCMMQYYQILSACRTPGIKHDDWACFPPDRPSPPRHVTVMYNNNVSDQ